MMDPLVMTLRAIQSAADNKNIQAQATWDTLNREAERFGAPDIDYDRFAKRWEAEPELKNLVDRFDGHGVVVKTRAKEQPEQGKSKPSLVSKMAKSATKRATGI